MFNVIWRRKWNHFIIISYRKHKNNQEIPPICRIKDTPEITLTGSTPYLASQKIINTSENMENVLLVSVDNSRTKLENYINKKSHQVAIKCLKEKTLNDFNNNSPSNQGDKINPELVKSLREQMEKLQREMCFFTQRHERKK